jgi:hypothetical protein
MAKLLSFKETSTLKSFSFFAQFEDNQSLSNLLACAACTFVGANFPDKIGKAKFTHPDAQKQFKFSVHFRVSADDLEDLALFMANVLSQNISGLITNSKVVLTEKFASVKHMIFDNPNNFKIPVIIEETLICSHCDQPVAEGKVGDAFKKRVEMERQNAIISIGSQISDLLSMKFTPERHDQVRKLATKIVGLGGGFTCKGEILRDMNAPQANPLLPTETRIELEKQWASDMHQDVELFMAEQASWPVKSVKVKK